MSIVVAVVGATGVVGREMASILAERQPAGMTTVVALASERSSGSQIPFGNDTLTVSTLDDSSFDGIDYALFSAGGAIAAQYAPVAASKGCVVIDNSSYFRLDPSVPLVVPEVNPDAVHAHTGIIANPNCSTAQLVVVLNPLLKAAGLKRVSVATYQSVSGAGKSALQELESQSRSNLNGVTQEPSVFSHPIAFNLIPQIDSFLDNGYTKEEMKVTNETRKILGCPTLPVAATAVRVPVFISHSEAVSIQTDQPISVTEARRVLELAPGVVVMDDPSQQVYPTPRALSGKDEVAVGRIRVDLSQENGLCFWCVGDNLRKGAALNAVQILELLLANRHR